MSSEIKYNINYNSTQEIMGYLIKKLESRKRNLSKYVNIFNSIDSMEIFNQKRNEIFNLFKNLEEELHQSALAIKALMIQNKALSHGSIETSSMQRKYNKLLKENNYLLLENNNYEQRLNHLGNNRLKSAKKVKTPKIVRSPPPKEGFIKNYKNENKNIHRPLKKMYSAKVNRINNYNTFENKKNNNNLNRGFDYDLDLKDINQLKNVKNIMKDMKNNRNKLKEIINEHFRTSHKNGNKRNNYLKNNKFIY